MQINTTWLVTGRPGAVLPELTDLLYGLRSGFTALKPGATAAPRSRASRHRTDGWDILYFLYQTRSRANAAAVERALVGHACAMGLCANRVGGGGGLRDGYPRYWVYVVGR